MSNKLTLVLSLLFLTTASTGLELSNVPEQTRLFEGSFDVRELKVNNTLEKEISVSLNAQGEISDLVSSRNKSAPPGLRTSVPLTINASDTKPGVYTGRLVASGGQVEVSRRTSIQVLSKESSNFDGQLRLASKKVQKGEEATFFALITSPQGRNVSSQYSVRKSSTGMTVANLSRVHNVEGTESFKLNFSSNATSARGNYFIRAKFQFDDQAVSAAEPFTVESGFWRPLYSRITVTVVAAAIVVLGGWRLRRKYKSRKEEEARYVAPSDYSLLPAESDDNYWVGKIAEADKEAFIDPDDLTTHAIVSGSTGSGKSVTASVIVEEALEQDIPIVCFDPTAQWTGFVKELKDDDLFEHYERFGMDSEEDPQPYPGTIKQIDSGNPDIEFKDLQNDGEITVFTLDQLTTSEFDEAVRSIIDEIFEEDWEESPNLEMLVIFDEVHRLLEEYGGEGGYHALERGAREFRKWGIGLMMCSQVTADFKQAISGNIMTEIQLQTKSMEDIKRVKKKYGSEFAEKLSSEDVGTGMIQNSNYNDGDPWFVDFRPTYHNPHKIPDNEMQKYHRLSERVDDVREKIQQKESEGEDMQDERLELDLADGKLKEGRFKMTSMYLDTLEDEIDV